MSDPHFASVVLLALNENGADTSTTFDDASDSNHTLTPSGDAQWDTDSAPTGLTSSGLFDGTGDLISAADSDDWTLPADLTIEFFARTAQTTAQAALITHFAAGFGTGQWVFNFNEGGTGTGLLAFWQGNFSGLAPLLTGTTSIIDDAWHHIALTRAGDVWKFWLDGNEDASRTQAVTWGNAAQPLTIGRQPSLNARDYNGRMAALRITKGVARYTANFTPPSLPLPTSAEEPAAPAPTTGTGGRAARRKPERWSLTVDGEAYVFNSLDALIAFLDSREVVKVEDAEEKAERDAKRVISLGRAKAQPAPPKVNIVSPTREIKEYADAVQSKIDRRYWRALADALSRQAEEDQDIAFIATLDL